MLALLGSIPSFDAHLYIELPCVETIVTPFAEGVGTCTRDTLSYSDSPDAPFGPIKRHIEAVIAVAYAYPYSQLPDVVNDLTARVAPSHAVFINIRGTPPDRYLA